MKRPLILIVLLLPLLASCASHTSLMYANSSLSGAKQGRECLSPDPLGFGRQLDLTGKEAMHLGGITKVQRIEYQVVKFHGVGKECVIARGE
jgi:hypothetical protein